MVVSSKPMKALSTCRKATAAFLFIATIFLVSIFYSGSSQNLFTDNSSPESRLKTRLQKYRDRYGNQQRAGLVGEFDVRVNTDTDYVDNEFTDQFDAYDTDTFAEDTDKLADDTDKLADGTDKFADDTDKLADDTDKLADDTDKFADDTDKLADDTDKLADDTDKLATYDEFTDKFATDDEYTDTSSAYDEFADEFASNNEFLADDKFINKFAARDDKFNDNLADDEFMKAQAEIQRQRKLTLQEACEIYKPRQPQGPYKVIRPKKFIVDAKYKLGYCSVAKIASTNWRLVFETLAGIVPSGETANQAKINRKLKKQLTFMSDFPPEIVNALMNTSVKFMFARHPFSRILSSYRNKLDPASTFQRAIGWQRRVGEGVIMRKYRGAGFHMSKTPEEFSKNYDLTFSEFVRFLGDPTNQYSKFFRNIHWSELYLECTPCNMDYDVIGKLETLNDDVKYILKLAHLDNIVQFSSPESSSPTYSSNNGTLERYFEDVPIEYIRNLYRRYKFDFDLFGYELPQIGLMTVT